MRSSFMHVGKQIAAAAIILTITFPWSIAAQSTSQPDKSAPPPPPVIPRESLVGEYNGGQMEVAARLLLKPDGHFLYELAYGSLDESAEGTWDVKFGAVYLTTVPAVVPPQFVVESDKPDPRGGLWIRLHGAPPLQGAPQRIYLIYGPNEEPGIVEIGPGGHVPFPAGRRPTAFVPEIPVYPIPSKPIPLIGTGGHSLVLRFEANDIGKADFRFQKLAIENGVLIMTRRDLGLVLNFRR